MKSDKRSRKKTAGKAAESATTASANRKSPLKAPVPAVPSILLEGDLPATPSPSGPGQKYALGPVPPPEQINRIENPDELPEAYGTRQLLLTARDPHWLYARWDLTREQQRKYNSLSAEGHLVIRVFAGEDESKPFAEVQLNPESTHWFVHVGRGGTKFTAELGYYQPDGKWAGISISGATLTPPDTLSEETAAQFATIPIEVPFARLLEFARAAVRQNIPLAEVVQQLRASGLLVPEGFSGDWTPEQEHALASLISMDRVRRVWMGSLEITELIRRQLRQDISSLTASQFSQPGLPTGSLSSLASLSSPFGGQESKRGFWFNINAELILYGATEPDAQVTIGGRAIKLRPDGTFSYRFALPDGAYELPAVAISGDQTDGRAAELRFSRETEYRGEIGAPAQDPQLRPPLAANIA